MVKLQLLCCFFLVIALVRGGQIFSITLDSPAGQIYASEGGYDTGDYYLYELDNVDVDENNVKHLIPYLSGAVPGTSSFVKKQGQHRYYYLFTTDGLENNYFNQFQVPFSNAANLVAVSTVNLGGGALWAEPVFDGKDNIALVLVARNLSLIDLATGTLLDSLRIIEGVRKENTGLVYNHNTNHGIYFYTARPLPPPGHPPIYSLQAEEFDIVGDSIVLLDATTFSNPDAVNGPFNQSVLTSSAIDYNHQKIWFLDVGTAALISFNVNDLSQYEFLYLPAGASFLDEYGDYDTGAYNAVFDFSSQLAYVATGVDATNHFTVYEIDLLTKSERRSRSYVATNGAVSAIYLDVQQGNLYLGFHGGSSTELGVINLGNLHLQTLTLV